MYRNPRCCTCSERSLAMAVPVPAQWKDRQPKSADQDFCLSWVSGRVSGDGAKRLAIRKVLTKAGDIDFRRPCQGNNWETLLETHQLKLQQIDHAGGGRAVCQEVNTAPDNPNSLLTFRPAASSSQDRTNSMTQDQEASMFPAREQR